ncbi:hypothetical protein YC2023_070087 [Brassica napus]
MLLIPLPYSLLQLKPPPLLLKPSPFQPPAILVVATTKFYLPSGSFTYKLNARVPNLPGKKLRASTSMNPLLGFIFSVFYY